jgi:tetratricopeptide (TPR) repeat protein
MRVLFAISVVSIAICQALTAAQLFHGKNFGAVKAKAALINRVPYLDMGGWGRKITTSSPLAQQWYNNGWIQMWGFNHEEAIRLFQKALEHDPKCAFCHASIAMSNGPNYNNPNGFSPQVAYDEIQLAKSLNIGSPEEKAIINALTIRFAKKPDGTPFFDTPGFANAMRDVYRQYGKNGREFAVAALFAEALMNLNPWTLWTKLPNGTIIPTAPETTEAINVLEKSLAIIHNYPPLCHLYVHAMELSDTPAKALEHADHLRNSTGQGHLTHMPSHIDMWVGQYLEAVEANKRGIEADEKYVAEQKHDREFYKLYRLHNYQFEVWASMFDGQKTNAMDYARRTQERITEEDANLVLFGAFPMGEIYLESYGYTPWQAMFRFGMWDETLAEPLKTNTTIFPATYAAGVLHRAIAFAATGKVAKANQEKLKFEEAVKNPKLANRQLHMNKMWDGTKSGTDNLSILNVGYLILQGLIAHAKGKQQEAEMFLNQSVQVEDKLAYDEPWGWMSPSRHVLGTVLLANNKSAAAEKVFRDDLKVYPKNLWALNGLHKSLVALQNDTEAATVKAQLDVAKVRADFDIDAASKFL